MPVFHTKTIESILEPVAQQVSQLVILHEEGECGNAIPDLTEPVRCVAGAVDNLLQVGRDLAASTSDKILQQDMPIPLERVEQASGLLIKSTKLLREDPHSPEARKVLISGSRGILSGTSALLLTFDEAEVRRIIRMCKSVLEYLAISEVVDNMEDLATFLRNLTPGLTSMTKSIEVREKELTHANHREMLCNALINVKSLTPILVSAIKMVVNTMNTSGYPQAVDNRNYVVRQISEEIYEMVRVLQLTTSDEASWEEDELRSMKRLAGSIVGKIDMANDWLIHLNMEGGGAGEQSLRELLSKTADFSRIVTGPLRSDIDTLRDRMDRNVGELSRFRAQGRGESPEARKLAAEILEQLNILNSFLTAAVHNQAYTGPSKPAPIFAAMIDQANQWLRNPLGAKHNIGFQALGALVTEARKLADAANINPAVRSNILSSCDDIVSQSGNLNAAIENKGAHSPEAKQITSQLAKLLNDLNNSVQESIVDKVSDDFMDTSSPLRQLVHTAYLPMSQPNRQTEFGAAKVGFNNHVDRMVATAVLVARRGRSRNRVLVEALENTAGTVSSMTQQVVNIACVVFDNPDDGMNKTHLEMLQQEWLNNVDKLTKLVDSATDVGEFVRANELAIRRDTEFCERSVADRNVPGLVKGASSIARRSNRVLTVANQEVDNSEDQSYCQGISVASSNLASSIAPMVGSAKILAAGITETGKHSDWRVKNEGLRTAVGRVGDALSPQLAPQLGNLSVKPSPPPRPPAPTTSNAEPSSLPVNFVDDDSKEAEFPTPKSNQPILTAAHSLHIEVQKWQSAGNEIIAAAKRMAVLMATMSALVRGSGGTKKTLIDVAQQIAYESGEVTRIARREAERCTDKRMRNMLLQVSEKMPTIATQLKILSTVKATMLGDLTQQLDSEIPDGGTTEDLEATEMLVGNAQNLMTAVRDTVRAAESASIKTRTDSGIILRWVRKQPW